MTDKQTRDLVVKQLLSLDPEFKTEWDDHVKFLDGEEADEYDDMTVVAKYLTDLAAEGKTQVFSKIFATVEDALKTEDETTEELIASGFFEDLRVLSSELEVSEESFVKHMGPKALELW